MNSIKINGKALHFFLMYGDYDEPTSIKEHLNLLSNDKFVDEDDLKEMKKLEKHKDWKIMVNSNVNDEEIDHDGSMFDSELVFESPDGEIYYRTERMSLMTGWDFYDKRYVTLNKHKPKSNNLENSKIFEKI